MAGAAEEIEKDDRFRLRDGRSRLLLAAASDGTNSPPNSDKLPAVRSTSRRVTPSQAEAACPRIRNIIALLTAKIGSDRRLSTTGIIHFFAFVCNEKAAAEPPIK